MIDKLTKILNINERTNETAKKLLPLVDMHGDEVIDSAISCLFRDSEVVEILNKRRIKLSVVESDLKYWLGLLFSGDYHEGFYKRIYNIGGTHCYAGNCNIY
jgi:hypothetical protein